MNNYILNRKQVSLLILSLLFVFSCSKKKEDTPAPTTTTTYNFTAKVDGVEYKSTTGKGKIMYDYFVISATKDNENLNFVFNLWNDSVQVKTYPCTGSANGGVYSMAQYSVRSAQTGYSTKSTSVTTDKITITKYDKTAKKISGTFNFTGFDDNNTGAKVVVTEGTFTDLTW